jgi:hypothetical protein
VLAIGLLLAGCQDLRAFRGSWSGHAAADPTLLAGFAADQTAALTIDEADQQTLAGTVTVSPLLEGVPVEPVRRAAGDALGNIRVGRDALRSYVGFAQPTSGAPPLVVISLLPDDRVELRVVRGADELYGIFPLTRQR